MSNLQQFESFGKTVAFWGLVARTGNGFLTAVQSFLPLPLEQVAALSAEVNTTLLAFLTPRIFDLFSYY